jgi:hypothetical protein
MPVVKNPFCRFACQVGLCRLVVLHVVAFKGLRQVWLTMESDYGNLFFGAPWSEDFV